MHNDLKEIIVTTEEIDNILTRLANRLNIDYADDELVVITVLCGSMIFASDLVRRLTMPLTMECMKVSSYGNSSVSSGTLNVQLDVQHDIKGKKVLIIEDIIDTGNTLSHLKKYLEECQASDVKICAMLDKPSRRTNNISPDYCGMTIPDEFVVGYGLDYAEKYRNLPYIGILKKEIYE